ncbi:MAG: hypothetical protein L6Q71_01350 [Planctomycetes bacterium]|nr:hypothetical protein [Planctomycetota bacterium]
MGLNMYAYVTAETIDRPVDFTVYIPVEIAFWHKHPNLHGWMEKLYRAKGGAERIFKQVNVQLTTEDLDSWRLSFATTRFWSPSGSSSARATAAKSTTTSLLSRRPAKLSQRA